MRKWNKGFTLVETLIALALLGIVMLFMVYITNVVSNISYQVDDVVQDSTDGVYVLRCLQKIFMQSTQFKQTDDTLIVVTLTEEIPIYIDNGALFVKETTIASLINGEIEVADDHATFFLILDDKSVIQTTFYLAEGRLS